MLCQSFHNKNMCDVLELEDQLGSAEAQSSVFRLTHPIPTNLSVTILRYENMRWSSQMQMQSLLKINCCLPQVMKFTAQAPMVIHIGTYPVPEKVDPRTLEQSRKYLSHWSHFYMASPQDMARNLANFKQKQSYFISAVEPKKSTNIDSFLCPWV